MDYLTQTQQLSKPEFLAFLEPGTIVTPFPLIEEIVDKLPVQWDNPNITFLDPCCGRGAFLFVIKNRLLKHHSEQHIVENMLFGVDLSAKNIAFAKAILNPNNKYNDNIQCDDSLKRDWKMKFDVVVGNPPFQDTTRARGKKANLWHQLTVKAFSLLNNNGTLSFITPSTWMSLNGEVGKIFKTNQLAWADTSISKHFPGVGSTFTAWSLTKVPCTVATHFINEKIYIDLRIHDTLPVGDLRSISIIDKVLVSDGNGLNVLSNTENNWAWKNDSTRSHLYGETQTAMRMWKMCHTTRADMYAAIKTCDYDTPKVVFPLMSNTPRPRYINTGIGSVANMSVHINVRNDVEGNHLVQYLTSHIIQYVMSVRNTRNSMTKPQLRNLPFVDLSRSWTDQELYQHFNLTQDEINLIESTIK